MADLTVFYNTMLEVMSAICAQKGLALENYVGRFFAADVVEFLAAHDTKFAEIAAQTADLRTPSAKPIHEMSLEEFQKVMNI